MKVFLIGLPASGKTTLGRSASRALHIPFVDLDAEIEKGEGVSIKQIFLQKGEGYFRKAESAALRNYCMSPGEFVMATGGGTPCFFDSMDTMNGHGITIFLDVPASELTRRIMSSPADERPLLLLDASLGLKDQIETLRARRISFYEKARKSARGPAISPETVLELIKKESPT